MSAVSWGTLALGYHIVSRLAYVLGIGWALRRQDRTGYFTRRYGRDAGFRRFRRMGSLLMANDGVSFIALCLTSRTTLPGAIPYGALLASGTVLMVVGVLTKLWARATLGAGAYYWQDFFIDTTPTAPIGAGPYRFLENPMYTVGYLQAYGFALATASLPGLVAAGIDQGAILAFYRAIEKPRIESRRRLSANLPVPSSRP